MISKIVLTLLNSTRKTKGEVEKEIGLPINSLSAILNKKKPFPPKWIEATVKYLEDNNKPLEVTYYHDTHCNASRSKPMGCEMCSCFMYQRATKAESEIEKLKFVIKSLDE